MNDPRPSRQTELLLALAGILLCGASYVLVQFGFPYGPRLPEFSNTLVVSTSLGIWASLARMRWADRGRSLLWQIPAALLFASMFPALMRPTPRAFAIGGAVVATYAAYRLLRARSKTGPT